MRSSLEECDGRHKIALFFTSSGRSTRLLGRSISKVLEAGMISACTKATLAAAKRRGVKLGGDRGARLTAKARAAGRAAVQERVRNRALDLAPTIQELQAGGCESLWAIAAGLEERGIPAARGGKWSAVQVSRLWRRPAALSTQAPSPPSRERQPAALSGYSGSSPKK